MLCYEMYEAFRTSGAAILICKSQKRLKTEGCHEGDELVRKARNSGTAEVNPDWILRSGLNASGFLDPPTISASL